MLQKCLPKCSHGESTTVGLVNKTNKIHRHKDADKQPACRACKKKEETLRPSCLHWWSVFYSWESLNADGCNMLLPMLRLISRVVLSSKSCTRLSLKAPQKESVTYPYILTLKRGLIYGFKHLTTGAGAPAEDWFKPFHLISFPSPLLPPFLISFIRSHLCWLKERGRKLVIQI